MITPDSGTRGKLREVLNALIYKAEIKIFRNGREALDSFNASTPPSLIFIGFSLGANAIGEFLENVKSLPAAKTPPVVATLDSKVGDNSSAIAALYIQGMTGFISEPYSTSELSKLLEAVLENKGQIQGKDRIRKATGFLLVDAMGQLDQLAAQLWKGEEPCGYPLRELKLISKNLSIVAKEDRSGYLDLMADIFARAKPPAAHLVKSKVKRSTMKAAHPGAVICELMKERFLTPERVASMLKVEVGEFTALMQEQCSVTEEMAKNLARVLGRSSREWLRLQSEYDLRTAKKAAQAKESASRNA